MYPTRTDRAMSGRIPWFATPSTIFDDDAVLDGGHVLDRGAGLSFIPNPINISNLSTLLVLNVIDTLSSGGAGGPRKLVNPEGRA